MKKTFVLMTIVLAILAAPVFAEVTISGDIDFGFSSDFAAPEDATGEDGKDGFAYKVDDLDLDITATVDEFTTVDFSLNFDQAIIDGLIDTDDDGDVTFATGNTIPGSFKVKTDVTGAFGIDSAADVTLITGYNDYWEPQDYQNLSRKENEDILDPMAIDKSIVIGADIVVNDMFTISAGINPNLGVDDSKGKEWDTNVNDESMSMWIGAYTTIDALSVEAFYNMGSEGLKEDDNANAFGLSANYAMPMGDMDFTFGGAFALASYEVAKDSEMFYAVSAKMVMGAIDAAVALNGTNEANDNDATLGLSFDAGYAVNETLTVYGGVSFDDLQADDTYFTDAAAADDGAFNADDEWEGPSANAGAEFGAKIMAGICEYYVGYQIGAGKLYNRTSEEGMFFRIQADY